MLLALSLENDKRPSARSESIKLANRLQIGRFNLAWTQLPVLQRRERLFTPSPLCPFAPLPLCPL